METRQIGSLEVTVVGLGTNNFGFGMAGDAVPPVVDEALGLGVNFFDTADSYGASEERLGQALGSRRDQVLIATKFGSPVQGEEGTGGARPEYVRAPSTPVSSGSAPTTSTFTNSTGPDPGTPISETLGALAEAVAAGKVREIGCSNFTAVQLREANAAAGTGPRFVSVQNQFNLLHRDDETDVIPVCEELGIAYLPFFPWPVGC